MGSEEQSVITYLGHWRHVTTRNIAARERWSVARNGWTDRNDR